MTKLKSALLIVLSLLLSLPANVYASREYTTTHETTYSLETSGDTQVEHRIVLKNNLANIYATSYTISIGSNSLKDITTRDENGAITPKVNSTENSTTITIPIESPAIGKDQEKTITVTYSNPDIAEHSGNIWEVNIPKLSNANEIDSYKRVLIVPESFPREETVTPTPTVEERGNERVYSWSGHKNDGITMFFGSSQFYEIDLTYDITNPTLKGTETEIALPPDTEYQRVYLESIDPRPKEISQDKDGNWMAIYPIGSGEKKRILVKVFVETKATPTFTMSYPKQDLSLLTKDTKYWQSGGEIQSLAKQLKTAKNIYSYIVENYTYNYERVQVGAKRLGAKDALKNPTQAICTEFTDTFVAMARSVNIPSREINGYAHTTNPSLRPLSLEIDVLHAWPEYYDEGKGVWVQIDPTWGNTTGGIDYFTKLDYNHITLVRHGVEDSYPFPAGTYKQKAEQKAIDVKIAEELPSERRSLKVINSSPKKIRNDGNTAVINQEVEVDGEQMLVEYLPPYGVLEVQEGREKNSNLGKYTIPAGILAVALVALTAYILIRKRSA